MTSQFIEPNASKKRCSTCNCNRDIADFQLPNGSYRATCSRHWRLKRSTSELFDSWPEFMSSLEAWNKLNQTTRLDVERHFSLDSLPYFFGSELKDSSPAAKSSHNRNVNDGCLTITDDMLKHGGFRFTKMSSKIRNNTASLQYKCCQDFQAVSETDANTEKQLYRMKMKRYHCESSLSLNISWLHRTLHVSLKHLYHRPYQRNALTDEVVAFIEDNSSLTPADIFTKLEVSGLPGSENAEPYQIYYRWHQLNSKNWRLAEDPLTERKG